MTLPIILLSVLALALGTLSVVLSLLVGRRYHQINRENSRTLNEFRDDNNRLAQQVRREGDRVIHLQSDLAICRSQIAQLNTSTGGFWRTGIGTIVQIRQMSDNHLEQALAHLKETGREGSQSWRDMLNEQRRRRHDKKMSSAPKVIEEFNKNVAFNPVVSAKEAKDEIDWFEVNRIIESLISRTGLSKGLNSDLWKLKHLLARGRKS